MTITNKANIFVIIFKILVFTFLIILMNLTKLYKNITIIKNSTVLAPKNLENEVNLFQFFENSLSTLVLKSSVYSIS